MYTRKQVKAIRRNNISSLASLGNVSIEEATSLYNRLVRYAKRRGRHGEDACNGIPKWMREYHEKEGRNLDRLHKELCNELEGYGLEMSLPGLYPWIDGDRIIELVWY